MCFIRRTRFGVNALGIVTMAQINARLVKRAGPRRMMTIGLIGAATGGIILLTVVLLNAGWPARSPADLRRVTAYFRAGLKLTT
jgi:hypothetical protein